MTAPHRLLPQHAHSSQANHHQTNLQSMTNGPSCVQGGLTSIQPCTAGPPQSAAAAYSVCPVIRNNCTTTSSSKLAQSEKYRGAKCHKPAKHARWSILLKIRWFLYSARYLSPPLDFSTSFLLMTLRREGQNAYMEIFDCTKHASTIRFQSK